MDNIIPIYVISYFDSVGDLKVYRAFIDEMVAAATCNIMNERSDRVYVVDQIELETIGYKDDTG